jgi:hypothetical protein
MTLGKCGCSTVRGGGVDGTAAGASGARCFRRELGGGGALEALRALKRSEGPLVVVASDGASGDGTFD